MAADDKVVLALTHAETDAESVLICYLLGVEAKVRQYAEGAAFTGHVVDAVGMERFNTIWTGPDTLPTRAEIADPAGWLRRVGP